MAGLLCSILGGIESRSLGMVMLLRKVLKYLVAGCVAITLVGCSDDEMPRAKPDVQKTSYKKVIRTYEHCLKSARNEYKSKKKKRSSSSSDSGRDKDEILIKNQKNCKRSAMRSCRGAPNEKECNGRLVSLEKKLYKELKKSRRRS